MKIAFFTLFTLAVIFTAITISGLISITRPRGILSNITPKTLGLTYEDVTLTTKDNMKLHAWFIPGKSVEENKTIILMHGYPADKGDILPVMAFLHKKYNLLLFDFRALGKSGGTTSTLGGKETQDLEAALEYLKQKNITKIGVWGFSMGGAVALMTAAEHPAIKVVIADSSYARLGDITKVLYNVPVLRDALAWFTNLWAKLIFGVSPNAVSPENAAKNITIPVLIMHSKDDKLIPFEHAKRIEKALKHNPKARFYYRKALGHGRLDKDYQKHVEDFFEKHL